MGINMNKITILASLLAVTITSLVFVSVSKFTPEKPEAAASVAIMDLNRVAKETGYSRQISMQINGLRTGLQNELTQAQDELSVTLNDKKEKFGDKPTKEQKKELDELFVNAKLQLQQAQQQAIGLIKQEENNLLVQLYDLVRPYAKRVANEKNMEIVMLKSDTLIFDHKPEADITDEVIAAIVAAKATLTPAEEKAAPNKTEGDNAVSQSDKADNSNS
jgi:Skp family chaperone for outer membrane proteins